jgi:hypothetical protein
MTTEIAMPIVELPNDIVLYILELAELPLLTRLALLEYGIRLEPSPLPYEATIERDICWLHDDQSKKFQKYYKMKHRKENYRFYENTTPVHTLVHYPALDCEIRIIEVEDELIFHFERIIIDYETEDMYVLRSTVCNALTGEIINQPNRIAHSYGR